LTITEKNCSANCCAATTACKVFKQQCTGCSIMIAPPSTATTSKTLAKLLLYHNNLNKVTLLCKVSDWCVVFNFKNIKNYKLVIHVAASSSNNSIRRLFLWLLALRPKISRLSCERTSGREPWNSVWRSCGLWWLPVSPTEMRRSFQLRSDLVLSDNCSSSIACHAESNRHCPVNDSKFFTVVLKTSAINICFWCFYLFSDKNHNDNNTVQKYQ